ncbi:hypothetical protein ZWY2020_024555 [Hordeum vulgare]|nr:hypothetical protein ZWY2020_024555 [Hordeum vulgare]
MPSHPKGWGESWFYCQETSPEGENKLLGYREERLPTKFKLPDKLTEEEESDFIPVLSKLRSLTNNGLTGIDLIRCWVEWRILPLSRRDGLMCEFDGTLDHPQCYLRTSLTENDIVSIIKKLTGEPLAKCGQIGLKPFCKINPAPKDNPAKDKYDDQADLLNSPKEGMEMPNPPSPLKTAEDPDAVIIIGTRFSKPASAVLSKHISSSAQPSIEHEISKAKLSQYENLEFKELSSGFASRLEASYEIEKSMLLMKNNRHEMEKLKAAHKKAQADQDAAVKRAEKAEAKLEAVQQELAGLKQHISNMAQDIFGPRAANLQNDCVLMLKAIYTLTEQLYTGSMLTVKAVMGAKEPITSIKKMLGCLSTLPPQIGELTRSAARKGVLTTLSRCLAYAPELKPEEVAAGFPQLKDDGSEFSQEDYQRVVKESRSAATQLAASLDLSKYQAAYDDKNKKVNPPTFVTTSLTPRRPKNPFDLEADLSSFLNDEDEFAALSKCNWVLGDLQIELGQSSKQADPGTSAE